MAGKTVSLLVLLVLVLASCSIPGAAPGEPAVVATQGSGSVPGATQAPAVAPAASKFALPDLTMHYPPPPIVTIPKSTATIEGGTYDAYQVPGNRIRVVCQQPCPLEERLIDAIYVGYQVSVQQLVRTVGFDVVDQITLIDVHLTRDNSCTRPGGEIGSSGLYAGNSNNAVICLYVNDADITRDDPENPITPETAIRLGGLGVFTHEYAHTLFFDRFDSSHDFVFPAEYITVDVANSEYYGNLCESLYQEIAPLSNQLCQKYGFTFNQLIQSLRDMNRLYEGGYGTLPGGMAGYAQYRAVLDNILGTDVSAAFTDAGYQKVLAEEGNAAYTLPYAGESCTYQALLDGDVTVPLGTMRDVNTAFDKTWRIKNAGTCNWDGVQLVYVRGEAMTATTSAPVPSTAAGATVNVTVPMTAPAEAGVHAGEWRLRSSDGKDFGPIINLTLYTRPGCSQPPQFSFFQAEPATIGAGALSLLSWGQVTNADSVEIVGMGSVDPNGNRLLVQPDQTTTYTLQATCGSNTVTTQATVTVDPGMPAFALTSVTAAAVPDNYNGACPAGGERVEFTGQFVSNGPGVVLYHWDRSDSAISNPRLYVFDQAGSQTLSDYWQLSASNSGWMELKILAPVESDPVQATFTLTCTP